MRNINIQGKYFQWGDTPTYFKPMIKDQSTGEWKGLVSAEVTWPCSNNCSSRQICKELKKRYPCGYICGYTNFPNSTWKEISKLEGLVKLGG
jgi:ribosomal protein S27AE